MLGKQLIIMIIFSLFVGCIESFKEESRWCDICTFTANLKVFTSYQEQELEKHVVKLAKLFYGLSRTSLRKVAYEYAVTNQCKNIPPAWHTTGLATRDWYYAFMDRYPNLSLKSPEGMSITRVISFNRTNVDTFFQAYAKVMGKYQFPPHRIYNIDETRLYSCKAGEGSV